MLDNIPASARFTRTRVETRILDLPLEALGFADLQLNVLPRQSRAIAQKVSVVERVGEAHRPPEGDPNRLGAFTDAHRPFVRLHVQRRTKLDQISSTGDTHFDISDIESYLATPDEQRRWYYVPRTIRTFTPETLTELAKLSERVQDIFAAVDWRAIEMTPEVQR